MDDFRDYRDYVRTVAAVADGKEIIQNKTPAHAGVLIAALFDKAEHEVLIVSGSLDGRAYGSEEVISATRVFLARQGVQLKIVVEKAIAFSDCKYLRFLRDEGYLANANVSLYRADGVPFHFLLADGKHFRFEADPTKPEAIAQFGAPSVELRNAFDLIVSTATVFTPA